jgi:hypothetical protein
MADVPLLGFADVQKYGAVDSGIERNIVDAHGRDLVGGHPTILPPRKESSTRDDYDGWNARVPLAGSPASK